MALSGKKLLLFGVIIVLLIIIPLTVYLVQQQQKVRVGAAKASILSLLPATFSTTVGQTFNLKVSVNPGTNEISFVKLVINFDSTKLSVSSACLSVNSTAFPVTLQGPTCSPGQVLATLSVGSSPQSVIRSATEVATVTFKAEGSTTTLTRVTFDTNPNQTQVLSVASADQFNENVLLNAIGSDITIAPSAAAATPTPTPTPTPSPGAGGAVSTNKSPVCTNLNIDRSSSGIAPYSITFTAIGNDTDGTITKVTFNFGDGPQEDVTTGGGIGTNSVNISKAHTYNNAGTFTATAVLTDNSGGTSSPSSCSKTITVTSAAGAPIGQVSTVAQVASPAPTLSPTPAPTALPSVGPQDIISVGAIGVILTILGVFLLFAL